MRVAFYLFIVAVLAAQSVFGQVKNIETEIESAVVFLNGAEIKRTGTVSLPKGKSELEITGLSSHLVHKTVQCSLGEAVRILSITSKNEWLSDDELQRLDEALSDSIILLKDNKLLLELTLENLAQEEKMLESNYARLGNQNGVDVLELEKASNFYRSRFNEISTSTISLQAEKRKLSNKLNQLEKRKRELYNNHNSKTVKVNVTVKTERALQTSFSLNYVVRNAGWVPRYNIRGEGIDAPVQFEYLAEVYNESGYDWQNINLTLSTANPLRDMNIPELKAWTLNFSYSYSAYHAKQKSSDKVNRAMEVMEDEVFDAEEIKSEHAAIEISEIAVDYLIATPYTIPSDGKPYLVEVKNYELPTSYKYLTIPKLETEAFLIAQMTDWEKVNIIDAMANIYYRGKYVGETFIDTRFASDTLEVSMGRDSKINITREKREDFNKKPWLGANRKESFEYKITVRNTYNKPIEIEVVDQVPVSQENEITVDILNVSGAELSEKSGRLTWLFTLDPSETKELIIAFSVKYPKNKKVKIRKSRVVAPSKFW